MRHRFQTRFSKREKYTKRIIARDYIIVFDIPLPRCDVMLDKKKKKLLRDACFKQLLAHEGKIIRYTFFDSFNYTDVGFFTSVS